MIKRLIIFTEKNRDFEGVFLQKFNRLTISSILRYIPPVIRRRPVRLEKKKMKYVAYINESVLINDYNIIKFIKMEKNKKSIFGIILSIAMVICVATSILSICVAASDYDEYVDLISNG